MEELNAFEAADIIGCMPEEVAALLDGQPATLEAVEVLAMDRYPVRRRLNDRDSYWVAGRQAAEILGVSTQRLRQYLAKEQVPFVVHCSGVRLMRREQLETAWQTQLTRRLH